MKNYLFGIELESFIPDENYNKFERKLMKLKRWTIDDDSSIDPDYDSTSMEIKPNTPLKYSELKQDVRKVTKLFKKYEVEVNDSCGFHLHMSHKDMEESLNVERITKLWISIEDFLFLTQPEERQESDYCLRKINDYIEDERVHLPKQKRELLRYVSQKDRYFALNLSALEAHGTIEIRLHAGTTDYNEIMNWVDLMTHFYDYALSQKYNKDEVEKLFQKKISPAKIVTIYNLLGIPDHLRVFYNKRIQTKQFKRFGQERERAKKIIKLKYRKIELQETFDKIEKELDKVTNKFERELDNLYD